jgi:hypothetical protein
MFGEFRVTKKSSGGVPGNENDGLNGVVGLVLPLEAAAPTKVSLGCRAACGEVAES